MSNNLPAKMLAALDELNENQLRALNRAVVDKLKLISNAKHLSAMAKFNVNDKVYFFHQGERICGTIARLNTKSVTILTDNSGHWNVAPSLLFKYYDQH